MAKSRIKNPADSAIHVENIIEYMTRARYWLRGAQLKPATVKQFNSLMKKLQGAVRHRERLVGR